MSPSLELVVARYEEPLNWVRKVPAAFRRTIYDKSANPEDRISLPNTGREAHTYLTHIVDRYDSLADYTVFCQGKPFDHAYDFHHTLRAVAADPVATPDFRWLGHLIDTDDLDGNRLFRPWSKNEDGRGLDIRGFHRQLFDREGPEFYTFVLGAQFIAHRDLIRRQPLRFYQKALELSVSFPDAAHCYERMWDKVFGVTGISEEVLQGRLSLSLKPIKNAAYPANPLP
ncbi:MAG: DUF3431 domain-containing protein [Siphonobacter aquaeclarae]|nr:DUF3431 domain-containing protein [Siphonobacter aquaeclarae]